MKLSTKGRYGLKAMVDLTVAYGRGYVSIATLAQQQGISESYLEQLIASLKKAGLVESVRGAQGGYALSRKPEEIDVGDCVDVNGASCDNACSCSARPLWLKLQKRIDEVLDTTTLADMAEDYKTQLRRFDSAQERKN